MKAKDLSSQLKKYKTGWVAIDDQKDLVVAHEKTFEKICQKALSLKGTFVMPASDCYFGFIT